MTGLKKYFFLLLLQLVWFNSKTQQQQNIPDSLQGIPGFQIDTAREEFQQRIERYRRGLIRIRQQNLLDEIRTTINHASSYQKSAINLADINKVISDTRDNLNTVHQDVYNNTSTTPSHRNLAVSESILSELLNVMEDQQSKLSVHAKNLVNFRIRIDSLASDSALLLIPPDSPSIKKYFQKIEVIAREFGPTDTALTTSINTVQDLQNEMDLMVLSMRSSLQEIDRKRRELTSHSLKREFPDLYDSDQPNPSIVQITKDSFSKEFVALSFYSQQGTGRIFMLIILVGFASYFLRSLKRKVKDSNNLDPNYKDQLVLKYPFLSALVIITCLFQFFFLDPPFSFAFIIWLIQAICLAFIFGGFISNWWMRYWITIVGLFVLASFDNFILQASLTERWLLQILALAGLIYGLYILIWGKRDELRERGALYFTGFLVLTQFVALLLNSFGRYNLAKNFMTGGYAGLVIAVVFLWTIRLINQAMSLGSATYRNPDKKLFYLNFEKLGDRVPVLFYILLVIGWCVLVGRNFYGFRRLAEPFNRFFSADRKLGSFTFSIESLLIFFAIMFCSVLLSRLISFIASEPADGTAKNTSKPGLGSWLLLIRIFIISMGLFLAFAATGIPLDRLTIVLGALSVGIGLGLQGMVTNLVSGLIIAFEKPVNVGDIIEIDKKQGTMKSIGFRSSTITMIDGSTIVIPNGDLLKGPLVNWTLGKRARRYEILVSVALGTDIIKVQQLLNDILSKNKSIRHYPAPTVMAKDFIENSVQFQIYFWADILKDSGIIKGEIIEQIDAAFRAEGIVIPNIRVSADVSSMDSRKSD